jgi:hypothetical protein
LARHNKKLKFGRLPKMMVSFEDQVPLLWLIYLGEKGRCKGKNFGQRIWDKVKCYWEHPWETHWELGEHQWENRGTGWEYDENTRILKFRPLPHPPKEER